MVCGLQLEDPQELEAAHIPLEIESSTTIDPREYYGYDDDFGR
jgi:hypothetical protein